MQAVICPVCKGEGQLCTGALTLPTSAIPVPVLKPCHGCSQLGWVVVPDVVVVPVPKGMTK